MCKKKCGPLQVIEYALGKLAITYNNVIIAKKDGRQISFTAIGKLCRPRIKAEALIVLGAY
jgi:hypothetical protein